MKASGFSLESGLTPEQIKLVLEDVHRLLERVGLEIDHPELRKELADHAGVTIKGDRVCYAPELVERARANVVKEDTNYCMQKPGHECFGMYTPFSAFNVLDMETDDVRPATDRDVIDGARLYDAFDAFGPVHVHIASMDQRIAQVRIARLCCEHSRRIGNWAPGFNYDQAMCIRDMYLAAGRPEPHVALQLTHSPLRLDAYFLDILWRARESENGTRGLTGGGGAMPLPGVSAPATWRSAAAQGLAEALGAWVTIKLINPKIHPYASFTTGPADLRTCCGTGSVPEHYAFSIFNRQVMRNLLGITEGGKFGSLDAMFLEAIQGARVYGNGGTRKKAFSLPQVVLDKEKLHYVELAISGLAFPEDPGFTCGIVEETLPETSFLMHEATVASLRGGNWEPRLFTGSPPEEVASGLRGDGQALLSRAREIARKTIDEHKFELPADVRREVARIYKRGCEVLTRE